MYKLYYAPGACSMGIHVALNECHQPVTLEKVDLGAGQNRTPEFLRLNPHGQIPVLVDGENAICEGAAILLHIFEKHPNPLLPQNGFARTQALQWMMFANATLHPAYSRAFFLKRNADDDATKEKYMTAAIAHINKLWEEVEEHLAAQGPYISGTDITIGDILLTVIANWSVNLPKPIYIGPKTKQLFQRVIARPSYQKALEIEQVTYKVAA